MIIDSHTHIFPNLEGASSGQEGSPSLLYLQKFVSDSPAQAVRRTKDNSVVEDRTQWALWDPNDPSPSGAYDVQFRLGEFGRLVWTKDGADYFMHLYGPSLQKIVSPPEFLLAQMDYAGVGMAVLQNAWIYGQMNDYFSNAVKKYPGRFVGSVQISEAFANSDVQIRELRRGVLDLGLKALYYANARFFENSYSSYFDDSKYYSFWDEVRNLGIPVYWDLVALKEPGHSAETPYERFSHQMQRFENWRRKYPEIPCILVHGVPLRYIRKGDELMDIPSDLWDIWKQPNIYLELLFPMQVSHPTPGGSVWDYPYTEVHPVIRQLYAKLGPEKLLWGSDMPNMERNCTYKQGRQYLERHCPFLSESDKQLLFSGNVARLLSL